MKNTKDIKTQARVNFYKTADKLREDIFTNEKISASDKDKIWVDAFYRVIKSNLTNLPRSEDVNSCLYKIDKYFRGIKYSSSRLPRVVTDINDAVASINDFMNDLMVDFVIFDSLQLDENFIELDENWKAKATSYVSHIRAVVSKAEIVERLRERIFEKLNELQKEIDRNRTRIESVSEVFFAITGAVNQGAKHLEGAVKLVERLAGAFSGARSARIEQEIRLQLPPPEGLGLDDITPTSETD